MGYQLEDPQEFPWKCILCEGAYRIYSPELVLLIQDRYLIKGKYNRKGKIFFDWNEKLNKIPLFQRGVRSIYNKCQPEGALYYTNTWTHTPSHHPMPKNPKNGFKTQLEFWEASKSGSEHANNQCRCLVGKPFCLDCFEKHYSYWKRFNDKGKKVSWVDCELPYSYKYDVSIREANNSLILN